MINKKVLDRLKQNLEGDTFTMPSGLSREQKRQFIIDCSEGKIAPDRKKGKK